MQPAIQKGIQEALKKVFRAVDNKHNLLNFKKYSDWLRESGHERTRVSTRTTMSQNPNDPEPKPECPESEHEAVGN
jgi:hypothetical protein